MADEDKKDKNQTDEIPEEGTSDEPETEIEDTADEKADVSDEAVEDEAEPDEVEPEDEESEDEAVAAEVEEEEGEEDEEEEEEEGEEEEVEDDEVGISGLEKVAALTNNLIRDDIPDFRPGDTVKVHVKIVEGNKERIQVYEGVVISLKHGGLDRTFTVRKTSWGVGVERTFFLHSTKIDKIVVSRKGRVRRAKLYFLRQRAGKSARIKERRATKK